MEATEKVIIRIELDPANEVKKLRELTLQLEANRAAQKELSTARKAGQLTDEEYSKRQVELADDIRRNQSAMRLTAKNLDDFNKSTELASGSIAQLRAQLAANTAAYIKLGEAERTSEYGQNLQQQTKQIRDQLVALEGTLGDNRRLVGSYAEAFKGALEPVIVEITKLQEKQKSFAESSREYAELQNQIGFKFGQAAQAGAQAGLTYEETTAKIQAYSAAIQPAVQNLVQLEQEQAKLVESGDTTSESFRKIGFQIAQTSKQIADAKLELPEIKIPTDSFDELNAALVKLREQQKGVAEDTDAFKQLEREAAAYQVAITKAGASAGKSFEEAKQEAKSYQDAIQPIVAAIVRLEEEQAQLRQGEAGFEQLTFQLEALQQQLKTVPAESKKVGTALKEVAGNSDLLSSTTARYNNTKEKFTQVTNLAKLAIGGEVTALGLLKIALAATGIGALVLVLGTLVTFLTKTAEGTKLVTTVMDQVGAAVDVVVDRFGRFGKAVTQVLSGDFSGAADTAKGALSGIGDELQREVKLAGDLSRARQQLERDTIDNLDTNKKLLNQVERLKNLRDDENNSIQTRKKANEEAFKIELTREKTLVDLQQRKVALLQAEIEQRGGINRVSLDQRKEFKEAQNELVDIQEDAAGKQNELITNRFQLEKEERERAAADVKAYYERLALLAQKGSQAELDARVKSIREQAQADLTQLGLTENQRKLITAKADFEIQQARLAFRQQAIQEAATLENIGLGKQLQYVQQASNEELNIRQRQLTLEHDAQLAAANLTVGQKKIIDAKYEADSTQLLEDTLKQRAALQLQLELDQLSARLLAVKKGSEQERAIEQAAIEKQRQQQLAAIEDRIQGAQREAAQRLINANADAQQAELVYQAQLKAAEAFFQQERNLLEQTRAAGTITEGQYQNALFQQELAHLSARRAINETFNRDTATDDQALTELKIQNLDRTTAATKASIDQQKQVAVELGEQIGDLFAQLLTDTGLSLEDFAAKTLVILLDSLEKSVLAATVEATAKTIAALPFPLGILAAAGQVAAIKLAFGAIKGALATPPPSQFAQGTVLEGAYHKDGGVHLYDRKTKRYFGEAEKDEIILTKGVYQDKRLFAAASALNVAGGGRPLLPARFLAAGGMMDTRLAARQVVNATASASPTPTVVVNPPAPIDYDRLARAMGKATLSVSVRQINEGQQLDSFTKSESTF